MKHSLISTIKTHASGIAKKLGGSRQAIIRSVGFGLIILALAIQFVPLPFDNTPSAEASPGNDMIQGGVTSKAWILAHYDNNTNNFQDVMRYNGITRAELASISNTPQRYYVDSYSHSWGWQPSFSSASGERSHNIRGRTVYSRPQALWRYSWYDGWEGYSAVRGKFRIMAYCGNLIAWTVPTPPAPTPPTPTAPTPPKPKPQPVATCDKLTVQKTNRNHVKLTASASAKNGATISRIDYYIFDENGKAVNSLSANGSSNHVFMGVNSTGKFTARAYAITSIGNITSDACSGNFTVTEQPVATCDKLTITKLGRNKFKFTGSASAKHGATISKMEYYVFDANGKVAASASSKGSSNSVEMTIPGVGAFTVKAYAISSVGRISNQSSCVGKINVEREKKPGVSITKRVNSVKHAKVKVGSTFTYEIAVSNVGEVDLKNVAVTDKAPAEVQLVKGSEGTVSGNQWTHTIPSLKVGQTHRYTITAKYAKYSKGTHKNTVCVDTPTVPGSPDGCDNATTETYEDMEVCDTRTNTIITIERSKFDKKHMTIDKSKCGNMKVCVIDTKEVKTIKNSEFNPKTMTTDMTRCAEEPPKDIPPAPTPPPTPKTPTELPRTGLSINGTIGGALSVAGLVSVTYAYIISRRQL